MRHHQVRLHVIELTRELFSTPETRPHMAHCAVDLVASIRHLLVPYTAKANLVCHTKALHKLGCLAFPHPTSGAAHVRVSAARSVFVVRLTTLATKDTVAHIAPHMVLMRNLETTTVHTPFRRAICKQLTRTPHRVELESEKIDAPLECRKRVKALFCDLDLQGVESSEHPLSIQLMYTKAGLCPRVLTP
jgi:hypothetical protein